MSALKFLIFLTFANICALAQYAQNPLYDTRSYYPSPCQSSCGNPRPTSYCQYLPCYSQYQYYQPYYYNQQYLNPYGYLYPGSRSTSYSGQYANRFVYPSLKTSPSDPYANVPVEIIDDDGTSRQGVRAQGTDTRQIQYVNVPRQNQYGNVPVEIIDESDYLGFWRNIPRLPPRVKQSSQSDASVSQGTITSESVTQTKPVRATITRTIQPLRKNPIINLDFVNGEPVSTKEENEEKKTEAATEISEKATDAPTTEENEEVSEVKNWI